MKLSHTVTRFEDGVLSLYRDHAERVGSKEAPVLRIADNWNVYEGYPLKLWTFFPNKKQALRRLLMEAESFLRAQEKQADITLFEPLGKWLRRRFKTNQFYLTQDGLCLFWQMGDVAPESAGIIEVLIPYEKLDIGCPAFEKPVRRTLKDVFPKFVRSEE
jgi:hypothetical protein